MPNRITIAKATLGFAAVATILGLALAGCTKAPEAPKDSAKSSAAVVAETPLKRMSLVRIVEQPGLVHAFEETQLFARVPGYISKVRVDIGQKVQGPKFDEDGKEIEPGQILADIAVPDLEAEANHKRTLVRQAEAEVEQANKALAAADANIATADASVIEAKALRERWESESKRIAALVKNNIIDAQTRDEVQNQLKASGARVNSTEAAVRKATADRGRADADVKAAEVRVEVAKADVRRVEAMLAFAKIRAPYDGVITVRKANTGDLVQPTSGKGEWMFTMARLDPVRIVVAVPEADAALVQEKIPVKLSVKAAHEIPLDGTITRISWALEAGARTLRAEIDVPNKDGKLRPGMYVYAHIKSAYPESWVLPTSAVVKQGGNLVCYAVEDGKVVSTPVQVGRTDGQFIEILKFQKQTTPPTWTPCTGEGSFALKASGLSDGQPVQKAQDK